jgi:hypothetical protein
MRYIIISNKGDPLASRKVRKGARGVVLSINKSRGFAIAAYQPGE